MGDLQSYKNLEYFEADSAEGLKLQLKQINLPYHIVSIYSVGNRHFAWCNLTRAVNKKKIKDFSKLFNKLGDK